jgi:hypothetical protein
MILETSIRSGIRRDGKVFMNKTTIMWRAILLSLAFVGMSGAQTPSEGYQFPLEGRSVLNASMGKELMRSRCSRVPPQGIEAFWGPSDREIKDMEKRLPNYLTKQISKGVARLPPPGAYDRQYLGIVVMGVRLIFGNYYPSGKMATHPTDVLVGICDGGPSFWGITFNPQTHRFANLSLSAGW